MPSMKALKRRITSVNNTQQIMKAMKLVATSKVQKNKTRMEAVRPLFQESQTFFEQGVIYETVNDSEFLSLEETPKHAAYIVIGGERSLCGGYNNNVFKLALANMGKAEREQVIAVGAKCKEYFVRRGKSVTENYVRVLESVSYGVAVEIAERLAGLYISDDAEKKIDAIYIVYTQFETLLSQTPRIVKLLPIGPYTGETREVIYEPDVHTYLTKAVPMYLSMFIYGAMIEASVCEQASRMTSMDAAARNASEIADNLTIQYNRIRQGAITQEISEIVSGANAV